MGTWHKNHRRIKRGIGFILLEVILSMMILGIAIAALMRSFTTSLATVRKAQIVTTACLLAQQKLEEYEVIPPQGDHDEGYFTSSEEGDYSTVGKPVSDPYRNYYFIVDLEEVEVDYPDFSLKGDSDEMENLTKITITIVYDDKRLKHFTPVRVETYLTTTEKFTYNSRKENKLY
jgi:type II secretory pathway pseudopilin PulG